MTAPWWVLLAVSVLGYGVGLLTWVRVAQREHYIPGRASRIALVWLRARPVGSALVLLAWLGAVVATVWTSWAAPVLWVAVLLPFGMRLVPRRTQFRFTGRVWRLGAFAVGLAAVSVLAHPLAPAVVVPFLPLIVDGCLAALWPLEKAASARYVRAARERLRQVAPTIVAITGSYGKTSTKGITTALLERSLTVVPSPASFNNRLGLSAAINRTVRPGTDVFVAEMGAYVVGEIAELCRLYPPTIAAITTIGEAHLERMGSRAAIVRAKLEITEQAATVVLNTDVPELAEAADRLAATKRVIRCSTLDPGVDVFVATKDGAWVVQVAGERAPERYPVQPTGHAVNLAVARGIALALRVRPEPSALPVAAHRAEIHTDPSGVTVIDDTYNANPVGAERVIAAAAERAGASDGQVFVVTPGMVELGVRQDERNRALAAQAAACGTLLAVQWTNRRSLASSAAAWFPRREAATVYLATRTSPGDVVVYLNDLPDTYP